MNNIINISSGNNSSNETSNNTFGNITKNKSEENSQLDILLMGTMKISNKTDE